MPIARFHRSYFARRSKILKTRNLGRLSILHILKADAQEIDLFTGRIDAEKIDALFTNWIDPKAIDIAFLCGLEELMLLLSESLRKHGLEASKIKFELFAANHPVNRRVPIAAEASDPSRNRVNLVITLDGSSRSLEMLKEGPSILETALEANIDAPYSCKSGICSPCRCKLLEGNVEMAVNHALEDYEVRAGYILSCQAHPLSDRVAVSYDE